MSKKQKHIHKMLKLKIVAGDCVFYDNDSVICNSVPSDNEWWKKCNYVCYCQKHPGEK